MTPQAMTDWMVRFQATCRDLMVAKNHDYQYAPVAFLDILVGAATFNIRPETVLWVFFNKQLSALRSWSVRGSLVSETALSRYQDVVNFATILACLDTNRASVIVDALRYLDQLQCSRGRVKSCLWDDDELFPCDRCRTLAFLGRECRSHHYKSSEPLPVTPKRPDWFPTDPTAWSNMSSVQVSDLTEKFVAWLLRGPLPSVSLTPKINETTTGSTSTPSPVVLTPDGNRIDGLSKRS